MNIYQKLKKAGYNTDGLASPLKIDPPKGKATYRDSVAINKKYQVLKGDGYDIPNVGRTPQVHNYQKSEADKASKKYPEVDKHFSTFDNRKKFATRHGHTRPGYDYTQKPKYSSPIGPKQVSSTGSIKKGAMDAVRSGLAGNVAPKKAATMTVRKEKRKLPKKAATMTHEKRKL